MGAVVSVAASSVLWSVSAEPVAVVFVLSAFVPGVIAARRDLVSARLPDRWVAATALLSFAALAAAGFDAERTAAIGIGVSVLGLLHALSPASFGFGDVKFGCALAPLAAVGGTPVESTATWLWLASGLGLVMSAVTERRGVLFGPCLLAAVAALPLANWMVQR